MRHRRHLPVLAAAILLAACASAPEAPIVLHPLDDPIELDVTGDYVHAPSSMELPRTVAGLRRTYLRRFDQDGYMVSALYRGDSASIEVTVGPVLRDVREELSADVFPPGAALESDCRFVQGGHVIEGHRRRMPLWDLQVPRGAPDAFDELLLFRRIHNRIAWYVKYRYGYEVEHEEAATAEARRFVEELWLP